MIIQHASIVSGWRIVFSLHNLGVNNKLLPLVYELNKKSEIRVKTPYGLTTPFTSPCIVKQGTVLGRLLCCASTAEICDHDDKGGASIGCATITSSLYVDDCNRFNTNINDAIDGHNEFMQFTMRKRLELNPDKCVLMIVNKGVHDSCPMLQIGESKMKEVKEMKILGDFFNNKGNRDTLIEARVKNAKGVITNMFAMCTELTFGSYYVQVMILMYRTVFVPSLIFNSQAWSCLKMADLLHLQVV